MRTFYYVTEMQANFFGFEAAMVEAAQEANRTKEPQRVCRLIEYTNGDSEHVHLCTVSPPEA